MKQQQMKYKLKRIIICIIIIALASVLLGACSSISGETESPMQESNSLSSAVGSAETSVDGGHEPSVFDVVQALDAEVATSDVDDRAARDINDDGSFSVTLAVHCELLAENIDTLKRDKQELVPEDGVILATVEARAYDGESVFNVLQRELRRAGVHLEFVNTPIYNSAYIEGIHNLYEFDAGELSGWVYSVNDVYPSVGCSRYMVNPGDAIVWRYSLALGQDVAGYVLDGYQKDD